MKTVRNELKIGVVLNYINMGVGNLIPIFYTPIMLRILGQSEYGLYKLSSVVTGYLGLISLGLGAAITRYLIKAATEGGEEAEKRMLGLFLIIFRFIALVAFIVGVIVMFHLDLWYEDSLSSEELQRMKILVFIMVCNTALSFSVSPYMSIVTAHEKFIFYQCMNILTTCVAPIVNLIALYMGYASMGLALSSLAIAVLVRIVYFIYVKKTMHITPCYRHLPTDCLKEIMVFSFWIFVANVVGQLYASTDTIMIGAIPSLAVTGVALYNVGIVFDHMVGGVSVGISSLLAPRINKMVFSGESNEHLTEYSILIGRLQCYMASCLVVGFIIFGKPLIHFYVGDEYMDSYWVMLMVSVPKIIVLAQSACLSIVIAKNKHRFRSLVYLGVAIVNVIGTWLVLEDWGVIGAAFMSGLSFFVGHGLFMNWFYWKKMDMDIWHFWKKMSQVCLVPLLLCVLCVMVRGYVDLYNIWVLLACMLGFMIVLFGLQWRFAFNDYEKALVKLPLKRLNILK